MKCLLCPHKCVLSEGQIGFCRGRIAKDGKVVDLNYGRLTSIALDPIEKKPLKRFHPGSFILSVGSYGCNLRCPWCQNYEISQAGAEIAAESYSPEELVAEAVKLIPQGNIGIAFTYNEPIISYEYVMDVSRLAHEKGLLTVMVSNGLISEEPLKALLPFIDAWNIDLKGFTPEFYKSISGDLETVKRAIELTAKSAHLEVTLLLIPGVNDHDDEVIALARWLSSIDRKIPLHISRFFPMYRMSGSKPTPIATVRHAVALARKDLDFVYEGNVW